MPPKETKGEVGSRSGWLKKCFAHTAAYSVFNPKNSTGRSPIFVWRFWALLGSQMHLSGCKLDCYWVRQVDFCRIIHLGLKM
jgi:hypothetical protein